MGKIILNNIEYGIGISNGYNIDITNLVEKDNIVTVIDENVTDEDIPSAKAVYDKLSDLPTDSGSKCYTTLDELGITTPVTVGEIFNAMPDKTMAILSCEAKEGNTDGADVHVSDVPISYGLLTIKKNEPGRFSIEYQNSLQGSLCNVRRWIGTLKGSDGTGLTWKLVSTEPTYVTLSDIGLSASATLQDAIDALPKGGSAILGVKEFTNYQTIFPYEEGDDQFARVHIVKGIADGSCMYARWFRKDGAKEAIAIFNINDNKFNGWQQVVTANKITGVITNTSKTSEVPNANLVASEIHGKYFTIADYSDALAMPSGKWRVDSNNKASQMQNLPVSKAGILEVKYLHGNDGTTACTGSFKYAMLTYTVIDGNKYERSFNSDGTVGNIINDTGWKQVIVENSKTDPYSCTGYTVLTGTEDLFTLPCGHYFSEKADTAYNYPITDSSNLNAHIYVLGHLNDPTNNKGYRIILYFDNKNRMYRINEWWGVFTDNGWQNMQLIGNGGSSTNYSTNEQAIGTWVDGKTIYRKTIIKSSHATNEQLISGVDTFIRGYGSCERSGYTYNVPHCGLIAGHLTDKDVTYLNFKLDKSTGALSTIANALYSISNLKVTLEYTKK